jgi:hypothetical protein
MESQRIMRTFGGREEVVEGEGEDEDEARRPARIGRRRAVRGTNECSILVLSSGSIDADDGRRAAGTRKEAGRAEGALRGAAVES